MKSPQRIFASPQARRVAKASGPTNGALPGARRRSASFLLAALALACSNSDPHVTYLGIVDATPPRLGRTENSVSPGDAASQEGDREIEGGTSANQDAGAADVANGGDDAAAPDVDTAAADGPG